MRRLRNPRGGWRCRVQPAAPRCGARGRWGCSRALRMARPPARLLACRPRPRQGRRDAKAGGGSNDELSEAAGAGGRRPEICLSSPSALANSGTLGSELVQGTISLPLHPLFIPPWVSRGIASRTPADTKNLGCSSLADSEILQPALCIHGFSQNLMRAVG